jgi:hypothetical protein
VKTYKEVELIAKEWVINVVDKRSAFMAGYLLAQEHAAAQAPESAKTGSVGLSLTTPDAAAPSEDRRG